MPEDLLGDAEVGEQRAARVAQAGQRREPCERAEPKRPRGEAPVEAHGEVGRVGGARELVHDLAHALGVGVGEVEGLAVETGLVGDPVERVCDEVDGHDVRAPEVEPHERKPLGQPAVHTLDGLEEVVGPVDLVHLPGARIADDDGGAVDAPGHPGLLANDALGLELGEVVGRGQALALVEHVLGERAAVVAGDGDRGDVVQAAGLHCPRKTDGLGGAGDVDGAVALLGGRHVVDGGEVEEVIDVAAEQLDLLLGDAEQRQGEVADDGVDARARGGAVQVLPLFEESLDANLGALAHEHVDVALAGEEALDEVAPDEARCAGYEVGHGASIASGAGPGPAAPLAGGEARGPKGGVCKHFGPRLRLQREPLGERHPKPLDRRAAIGEHRALWETREPLGQLQGPLQMPTVGNDLGQQAHPQGLLCVDDAPGEDQIERAPEAEDPRRALRAAVDQRDSPAPLGKPQARAGGGDAKVAPKRELESTREREAGDRGDGGLGGREAREPHRPLGRHQPSGERLGGLEVRAGAEGDAAGAGEHEHARPFVGLEGQEPLVQRDRGGPVHGIAPRRAVDREQRGGADALVANLVGVAHQPPRQAPLPACAFWAALRAYLRLSRRH